MKFNSTTIMLNYKDIAKIFKRNIQEARTQPFQLTQVQRIEIVVSDFVKMFEQQDSNFNKDAFLDDIGF